MADTRCIAIKSTDGNRCSLLAKTEGRCNRHHNGREREGPNRTERNEHNYVYKRQSREILAEQKAAMALLGENPWTEHREQASAITRDFNNRYERLRDEKIRSYQEIVDRQRRLTAETGINPDAVQDARRVEEHRLAMEAARHRMEMWRVMREAREQQRLQHHAGGVAPQQQAVIQPREGLAGFANDRQNVHTTVAVRQTMNVIREILKIEVPSEYRWNMKTVSKTVTEIMAECQLTPDSAWQMVSKYCSDETIYDLQPGIYGKVLDCVWQYIQKSDDKECLKKILKSELKDNIGMCAQGNLSRLTNILAGYLQAVVIEESLSDKLGRMLPPLMEIEDIPQRLIAAARVFVEVELPEDQWHAWGQGLLYDQEEDDYREMFIHDGMIDFLVAT